jgi:hypothetical protein
MSDVIPPKIGNGGGASIERDGQFFISRGPHDDKAEYLHPDGRWRSSTKTDQGWTGWYESEAAAQAVIDKYC